MVAEINGADPRVKRTRQLLHHAVLELIHEKAFRHITVQDIADRATVNRATFYAHYEDKFALMEDCIRDMFWQALDKKLPKESGWSVQNLRAALLAIFEFLAYTHGECAPADREFDPLLQQLVIGETQALLMRWYQAPNFPGVADGVAPETVATLCSWAMYGAASQWIQSPRRPPAEQVADAVVATLTRCLRGAPPVQSLPVS